MSFEYDENRRQPSNDTGAEAPPRRDGRGRFAGGRHNPRGRPRKKKPPTSMSEAFARALSEEVAVTIKGKTVKLAGYEALSRKLTQMLLTAGPLDASRIIRLMHQLNVFDELKYLQIEAATEPSGSPWTEELERQYRLLESSDAADDGICYLCGHHPDGNEGGGDSDPASGANRSDAATPNG